MVDAVGGAGVDRRIDVMATVVHFGGTIDEIPGDRPVLVHYQVGRFSNFACRILMGLGRRDVVSPSGRYAAYAEWQEASGGLPA